MQRNRTSRVAGESPDRGLLGGAGNVPENVRRFTHHAMATVFQITTVHDDAGYSEQCAHEAFRELDRLEQNLSRFIENSDVSRVNAADVDEPVRVGVDTFECLEHCARLSVDTNGACDVTIGLLLEYWARVDAGRRAPSNEELLRLRESSGMRHVDLDSGRHTVTRRSDGVSIDLGGYGKGYAVDRMAKVLDDWDIGTALVHGGTSSVLALGAPPGERGWQVTMRHPSEDDHVIERLYLERVAISGSGTRKGRHVIDPRTAYPVTETAAAWAITATAAAGDALSTAFMIMSPDEIRDYCVDNADSQALMLRKQPTGAEVLRFGDNEYPR